MAQMFKNNRDSNMNLHDLNNIQDLDDQNDLPLIQQLVEKGIYDRDGSKEELQDASQHKPYLDHRALRLNS